MDFSGFNFDGIAPKPGSPSKMAGSDGVIAPGGFLISGERNRKLNGNQKWITFANAIRGTLIVAASLRAYNTFARSATWTVEPNKLGGKKAQKMADIATDGLIEAAMPKPWNAVVGKTLTGAAFQGFSMHEWQGRRRETPGRPWVFTNIEHRPQQTILQWLKPNEREPWVGVIQRMQATGSTFPMSRARLFYFVDDSITDQPDGAGFLQHLIEHADHMRVFEKLEGQGFQSNLAGVPFGWAPLGTLRQEAIKALGYSEGDLTADQTAKVTSFVTAQVGFLVDFLENHVKTPELSLLLPSEPYHATGDGKTVPSALRKWAVETMRTTGLSFDELSKAINRVGRELARVMNTEWMMMGDSEGARSVHGDKTNIFLLAINSMLKQVGFYATAQLAVPMTELNGYDADTCAPRIKPQPIPMESIESVCRALGLLSTAVGTLPPDWEGTNVLLARADLPPIDLEAMAVDAMLPRTGAAVADPTKTPAPAGKPSGKPKTNAGDGAANNDNPGAGATT